MACPQNPEVPVSLFPLATRSAIMAKRLTLAEANQELRYLLNELKAIDGGEEVDGDQALVVRRLRALADHIETGGICPDANAIVSDAAHCPIQR